MPFHRMILPVIVLVAAGLMACAPAATSPVKQTVEVTRVVEQTVPVTRERQILVKVTRVVEQTVEVTRIVNQPIEVTRVVEQPVEVTRQVPVTVLVTPTPAPTATPVQRITPIHDWTYTETDADAITGASLKDLGTMGQMIDEVAPELSYGDPQLVLRCKGDNFQAFTHWGGRHLAGNALTNTIPTTVRVDAKQPRSRGMDGIPTDDNAAAFFLQPRAIVREMLGGMSLVVRVTNADDTTLTARFPVAGLHTQLHRLPCH